MQSESEHHAACRALADRLFEIIYREDASLSLDALGMTLTRVLLEAVPVAGKTHREVFEDFMEQTRRVGERVMKVLDLDIRPRSSRTSGPD